MNQEAKMELKTETPVACQRLPWKWLTILVVLLGIMGGSAYYGFLQWKDLSFEQRALQKIQYTEQDELSALKQKYDILAQQLQILTTTQESLQTILQNDIKPHLDTLQNRVPARDQTVWLVAEANYLVQLAYQRLYVMRDVENTIKLLELADQKIQTIKDSQYLPIREALKYDITKLKGVHMPDLAGIWFTIATLLEDIQHLPILRPSQSFTQETIKRSEPSPELTGDGWRSVLKRSLLSIKDLMRIRHHDKPMDTRLFVTDPGFVVERLRLLLEQVRWAALNENPDIYSKGILQAQEWLQHHFDARDSNVQYVVETLSSLSALDIKPELPEVLSSVRVLNEANKRL